MTSSAIRGLAGVRAEVTEQARSTAGRESLVALLSEAIPYSASPAASMAAPCAQERTNLHNAFTRLQQTLFVDGDLALRLSDGVGYKTYEPSELPQHVLAQAGAEDPMMAVFPLSELFSKTIATLGASATAAATFDQWEEVVEGIIQQLSDLQSRQYHSYNAYAYLNAPLCDFHGSRLLLGTAVSTTTRVFLGQATDADLSRVIEGFGYAARLPAGLWECNSLLTIPLSVPVLGTVEEFESCYPMAADLAARVLDVLRIVFGEDIGICALTIESKQFGAPTIRPRHHTKFNPLFGAYLPQRVAFLSVPARPITEGELSASSALLARHLSETNVKGFGVALRRFRDAWERHWPESPERLLDIAIALEALFLNDGDEKELRHRLALRVARFLEIPGPRRLHLFRAVRQLYDLRSKVAHGATLQNVARADAAKLAATMAEAPAILRAAMRRMIEGAGPTGLNGEALAEYWRQLELG